MNNLAEKWTTIYKFSDEKSSFLLEFCSGLEWKIAVDAINRIIKFRNNLVALVVSRARTRGYVSCLEIRKASGVRLQSVNGDRGSNQAGHCSTIICPPFCCLLCTLLALQVGHMRGPPRHPWNFNKHPRFYEGRGCQSDIRLCLAVQPSSFIDARWGKRASK